MSAPTATRRSSAPSAAVSALHHPAERGPGRASLPAGCPRVSVVVPTRNEAANLPWVLARLPHGIAEVVLVDGGSTDGTVEVARTLRPDVVVVQQTRTGKGNALVCGFAAATGEILVMLDADGSAHPAEIPRFVQALLDGADVAKGRASRRAAAARTSPGSGGPGTGRCRSW